MTPDKGSRWWMEMDEEELDTSVCLGDAVEMLVGKWPDVEMAPFTVVRLDRLRHKVLLEAE